MAPAVKIIDKRPTEPHRHHKIYQVLGKLGVCAKKVHDGKGVFFAITNDDVIESILSDVSKEAFRQEGFEVVPPIVYNSMKTVVVKQLDYMIDSFNDEEIIDSIEILNKWAKVESIYKIPSTSKILKIRFKTQQMAQLALDNGIKILHQYISKWNVEKEVFVRLNPCRNCFQYDHKLKDCKLEKKSRCTFCAGEHRQHECKAKQALCINCGGPHRTLAATCKIRKDLIKKRSGEMRDQIRTQTRQQQFTSYADATSATKGSSAGSSVGGGVLGLSKDETKQMVTTIMSAIVYSHYVEAIQPGSFQESMRDMYKCNGLKPVNFPTPPMADMVAQTCKEVFLNTFDGNSEDETDNQTTDNAQNDGDDLTLKLTEDIVANAKQHTEQQQIKRQRESLTPPNKDEKRKKEENTATPLTPKKKSNNKGSQPQRLKGEGGSRSRRNSKQRESEEGVRSRSPSTSSTSTADQCYKKTKDLGLVMYMKKLLHFNADSNDHKERNRIRTAAIEGNDIKFKWDKLGVEWETIINSIKRGTFDFSAIQYVVVDDDRLKNIISQWTGYDNI